LFQAGHVSGDWLTLPPGSNALTAVRAGGDATSTIQFEYDDGWL
jgi:hypothetical protein